MPTHRVAQMLMKAARANTKLTSHLDAETAIQISRKIWGIGDWLNYGERSYGEMYAQAVGATGYENGTLRTAKWVAGAYELSMRMDNLSWAHHQIVAALPIEERTAILDQTEREGWSCAELRRKKHTRLLSP